MVGGRGAVLLVLGIPLLCYLLLHCDLRRGYPTYCLAMLEFLLLCLSVSQYPPPPPPWTEELHRTTLALVTYTRW